MKKGVQTGKSVTLQIMLDEGSQLPTDNELEDEEEEEDEYNEPPAKKIKKNYTRRRGKGESWTKAEIKHLVGLMDANLKYPRVVIITKHHSNRSENAVGSKITQLRKEIEKQVSET